MYQTEPRSQDTSPSCSSVSLLSCRHLRRRNGQDLDPFELQAARNLRAPCNAPDGREGGRGDDNEISFPTKALSNSLRRYFLSSFASFIYVMTDEQAKKDGSTKIPRFASKHLQYTRRIVYRCHVCARTDCRAAHIVHRRTVQKTSAL